MTDARLQQMFLTVRNLQDPGDPYHDIAVKDANKLSLILDEFQRREPFIAELRSENGFNLIVGIGGPVGCAQYANSDGLPPYLVAVLRDAESQLSKEVTTFLCGGQETEISNRHSVPFEVLKRIVTHFLETGDRSAEVDWEEV